MKYAGIVLIGLICALVVAWGYESQLLAGITCAAIAGVTALVLILVYGNDHGFDK